MENRSTIDAFIEYAGSVATNESHLLRLHQVLEMLAYIQQNIDDVLKFFGKKDLFRHPQNNLAVHLDAYADSAAAKRDLLSQVENVETCLSEILAIHDENERAMIANGFSLNINDSAIGCMEFRLHDALIFYTLYKTTGCITLEALMANFFAEYSQTEGLLVESALLFFAEKIRYKISVLDTEKNPILLQQKMITKLK